MQQYRFEDTTIRSGVLFGTSGARGLVEAMSDELCYAYTTAFLQSVAAGAEKVVVGHDLRPSSPRIAAACAAAIQDSGREWIYAGALPTPALAAYAAQLGAPAIVVTGSHIPFDRNGIKFYRADGEISKADEQAMLDAAVSLPAAVTPPVLPLPDGLARAAYVQRYLDFFEPSALQGLTVAVYEHSSVGRDVLRSILEGLGAQVIALGRTDIFVPIDTEAVRPEDVAQARQWATEYNFDALLSTDGDADRPLIGDENGEWLRGDVVGILCAKYLQAQVVVTPVSSNTAAEKSGVFTHVARTRIGSPYVIAGMDAAVAQGNALVVGYEANGGFLLGSDVVRHARRLSALPTRDAVLPMLALLCMAQENRCKLSALTQDLPPRFTASDRLQNFATEKSRALLQQLLEQPVLLASTLAPQSGNAIRTDQTDGLRVTFESGDIVHLRPSGNAPELRCYAEADTPEHAKLLCDACLIQVRSAAG
ncbi:phosphomannomutase [Rhodoferax sp. OV413]|uniref:phosphomannomutase n=1 Tax=Rhodoferax sp. OV413 TaxID=1855285 RepID=UPI0008819DBC|nr:phosphomannomutase [Rhodoferax sp. OV413]SDP79441.1 phosphomannomutase [Rhodoferax sp. OV413]